MARITMFSFVAVTLLLVIVAPMQTDAVTGACWLLIPNEFGSMIFCSENKDVATCDANAGVHGGEGSVCATGFPLETCTICFDDQRILFKNDGSSMICVDPLTVDLDGAINSGYGYMPACDRDTSQCRFQPVTGNKATFLSGVFSTPGLDNVDYCANCDATPTGVQPHCPVKCACGEEACCDPATALCDNKQANQCASGGGLPGGLDSVCAETVCARPPTMTPTPMPTPASTVDYCACPHAQFVNTPSASTSLSCASAYDAQTPELQSLTFSNIQEEAGGSIDAACIYEGVAKPSPRSLNSATTLDVCGTTLTVTWTARQHPLCNAPSPIGDDDDDDDDVTFTMEVTVRRADVPVLVHKPSDTTISCADAELATDPSFTHEPLFFTNMESTIGCQIVGMIDVTQALSRNELDRCGGSTSFFERTWSGTTGHVCDASSSLSHTQRVFSQAAPRSTFSHAFAQLPRDSLSCLDAAVFASVPLAYSNAASIHSASALCSMAGTAPVQVTHTPSTCGGIQTQQWNTEDACGRKLETSLVRNVDAAPPACWLVPVGTTCATLQDLPADDTLTCAQFVNTYQARPLAYANTITPPFFGESIEHCAIAGSVDPQRHFPQLATPPEFAYDVCGSSFTEKWRFTDTCGRSIEHSRLVEVDTALLVTSCCLACSEQICNDRDADAQFDAPNLCYMVNFAAAECEQLGGIAGASYDSCSFVPTGVSEAICNGIDDNGDGRFDEDFKPTHTECGLVNGPEHCKATGFEMCTLGGILINTCKVPCFPDVVDNICGEDLNCNGVKNEDYEPVATTCGIGACEREVWTSCGADGVEVTPLCEAGEPLHHTDRRCNGIDKGCVGVPDQRFQPTSVTCGHGVCKRSTLSSCEDGELRIDCVPGEPFGDLTETLCNGLDDTCTGAIDNNYQTKETECGLGACKNVGQMVCSAGGVEVNTCVQGSPLALLDTVCGLDLNCDGTKNEDYLEREVECGKGVCKRTGVLQCSSTEGTEASTCIAGLPEPNVVDNVCGLDLNCNGIQNEDYQTTNVTCGKGACKRTGELLCSAEGIEINTCVEGLPVDTDANCDNIDGDCDGEIDNHFVVEVTLCGIGACYATGNEICLPGGVLNDTCTPGTPALTDTNGDGHDSDCNGLPDDGTCGGHGVVVRRVYKQHEKKKEWHQTHPDNDGGPFIEEPLVIPEGKAAICFVPRRNPRRAMLKFIPLRKVDKTIRENPLSYKGECRLLCECENGYGGETCSQCESQANGGLSSAQMGVCRPLPLEDGESVEDVKYTYLKVCAISGDEDNYDAECISGQEAGDILPSFDGSTGLDCACRPMRGVCYVHSKTCLVTAAEDCALVDGGDYQVDYSTCDPDATLWWDLNDESGSSSTSNTATNAIEGGNGDSSDNTGYKSAFVKGERRGILYVLGGIAGLAVLVLISVALFVLIKRRRGRGRHRNYKLQVNADQRPIQKGYRSVLEDRFSDNGTSSARELDTLSPSASSRVFSGVGRHSGSHGRSRMSYVDPLHIDPFQFNSATSGEHENTSDPAPNLYLRALDKA